MTASRPRGDDHKDGVRLASRAIPMPAGDHPLHTDYVVYDEPTHAVWIPTGTFPRVDVFDTAAGTFRSIAGFPTREVTVRDRTWVLGPSSATLGVGVVYVGNRADQRICAVDLRTLSPGACVTLEAMPDGITYVPERREIWVTTPRAHGLAVVHVDDAGAMQVAATLPLDGQPEGYAVDAARGLFFTNLEDLDQTLVVDMARRAVVARWSPGCGEGGARGLISDPARHLLFVACQDHTVALDTAHDGARRGAVGTGEGVDDLGYWPARGLLYAASSHQGVMRVLQVSPEGALRVVAHAVTAESARNAVVDEHGRAYVVDARQSRLFVVEPPPP